MLDNKKIGPVNISLKYVKRDIRNKLKLEISYYATPDSPVKLTEIKWINADLLFSDDKSKTISDIK